jgi:hypothetical protein
MGLVFRLLCRTVCVALDNVFEMIRLPRKSRPYSVSGARSLDLFPVADMRENHYVAVAGVQPQLYEVNLLLCSD